MTAAFIFDSSDAYRFVLKSNHKQTIKLFGVSNKVVFEIFVEFLFVDLSLWVTYNRLGNENTNSLIHCCFNVTINQLLVVVLYLSLG